MLTNQFDESAPQNQPIPYVPTEADASEAAQVFGSLSDDLDVAEFEAWIDGLQHERFRSITRAIEVLRSALIDYRAGDDGSASPITPGSVAGHESQPGLYT